MNGVYAGGAFDRVVILRSERSECGATETGANTRLDGIGGQQTGQSMHLPLDLDANDGNQSWCHRLIQWLAESDARQCLDACRETDALGLRPAVDPFARLVRQPDVLGRGMAVAARHCLTTVVRRDDGSRR